MLREVERIALFIARQILNDLGDHIAGALDDNPVPGPNTQAFDFVAIMQRDVGYEDSTHRDRHQPAHWRQFAGSANLNIDRLQRRFRPLGRKFMGQRPTRRLGNKSEPSLPIKPINLVNDAINIIGHSGTALFDHTIMIKHGIQRIDTCQILRNRDPPLAHGHHHRRLALTRHGASDPPAMGEEVQIATLCDRRIELTQ